MIGAHIWTECLHEVWADLGVCGRVHERPISGLGEVDAVGWGEYVDELVLRLRRDGGPAQTVTPSVAPSVSPSVAEAVDAAAEAVARVTADGGHARHARVAAMRIAFARDCVGGGRTVRLPTDLPAAGLLADALRLVAAAHDALRAGHPLDSPVAMLARVRARVQLRAAYEALSREKAERLEAVAAR
jgi:hypothetical protein